MGGPKDKALLGRKGQGGGRGYVDFLPGGGGGRRTRVECPATPPWGEGGRNLQAHGAEGTGTQTLGLGHRTGGDTVATPGTLGWVLSCVIFRAAGVDPERRRHKGAAGTWQERAGGLCPGQWPVPALPIGRGLGYESVKAKEPRPGKAVRSFQGLGWLRGSNVG